MKYQLLLVSFIFAFGYIAKANLNNDGYLSLFNGKDLKGWNSNDSSKFKVENAQVIGFQEDGKGANLFTDKEYDNFSLRFSYKVKWPANSGIWFRNSYQFDILKY
ncbi:MAG: 3-keto-disaccharide hydrolase, partial [Verrucomicrobiia bacterium]